MVLLCLHPIFIQIYLKRTEEVLTFPNKFCLVVFIFMLGLSKWQNDCFNVSKGEYELYWGNLVMKKVCVS